MDDAAVIGLISDTHGLMRQKALSEMNRPLQIRGALMKVFHQEPAKPTTGQSNRGRDCDARAHACFEPSHL